MIWHYGDLIPSHETSEEMVQYIFALACLICLSSD